MSVLSRSALEASPLADLHAIAGELGIDGFRRLRREDLVAAILDRQGGADVAPPEAPAPESKKPAKPKAGAQPPPPPLSANRIVELGWLKAGETRQVRWQVRGTGAISVSIGSTRGGTDRKEAVIQ